MYKKDKDAENNKLKIEGEKSPSIPKEEQIQAIRTAEFVKETIKQRPLNKKRLARRLIVTVSMAVVFGMVACLTFLILEPIINQRLNPEQEVKLENITFAEKLDEEETLPKDMIADESELQAVNTEQVPLDDEQIEQVLNKIELGEDELLSLSAVITNMINETSKSMVSVVGITKDTDWFNNSFENEESVAGVIIADNGRDLLILADLSEFTGLDNLQVKFFDETSCISSLVMQDKISGLAVVGVNKARMHRDTIDQVKIIEMGSSANKNLSAIPIIALGRPIGIDHSTGVGHVSSYGSLVSLADANYRLITTDISGNSQASGFLVNIKGQLLGIISVKNTPDNFKNVICGLGISELKRMIEKLSNGIAIPYLGIYGSDVTKEISEDMNIPMGVYITRLDMESPLLESGIQSGDIITGINGISITTFQDMNNLRLTMNPEDIIDMEVMRSGPEGYTSMTYSVTIGNQ